MAGAAMVMGQGASVHASRFRGITLIGLAVIVIGSGLSVFMAVIHVIGVDKGSSAVCVSAPSDAVRFNGAGGALIDLRPEATFFAQSFNVCSPRPSVGQALLSMLTTLPSWILAAVAFSLVMRILDSASRGHAYLAGPRKFRALAAVSLFGGLAVSFCGALANLFLFKSLIGYSYNNVLGFWSFPWTTTLLGVGLWALSITVRSALELSDDLSGTV